ncbi:ribulokinase [Oscillatoria laete-virens NRMC-F 0139]|nr:ribulokinase [Oscillatoria laete-virens]MDL5055609.1 ribulokinase [Oscillatoria laete-virens NRMC-F 0139]
MAYTIGVDYGTNSVRALVVDCANGKEIGTHVFGYPSGHQGVIIDPKDPHLARQHPADYLAGLETSIREALKQAAQNDAQFAPEKVIGIGVDTTGSSPIPVDANGTPLALLPAFKDNPNALCWLWKDHTSVDEAQKITETALAHRPQYVAKCGNIYSSEWFWAKIWHCLNVDAGVFDAADSWVELSDYIPAVLAGVKNPRDIKRGVCAAGHKAMYCGEWGGLPDEEFLSMLDPRLGKLRGRLYDKAYDLNATAGTLCAEWAGKLGLPSGIVIAIGAFDVHLGCVGVGIREGVVVKAMGTSTCDCGIVSNSKKLADIPGICGIVDGSILPGFYGLEAGQSAVGDIFKWFVEVVCKGDDALHGQLTAQMAALKPGQNGLLALDWNNGNRTVLVDQRLTGLLVGQTLHTSQAEIYRALVEATAFGARVILERFKEYGVPVTDVVCCGGIAEKNAVLMQIYADVTGCEMKVSRSPQTCALGSAVARRWRRAKTGAVTRIFPRRWRP